MRVNYVDEMNLFMRYARSNQLSARERLFWVALFSIANERAVFNAHTKEYSWPADFFPVQNGELSINSTLDKRGIESVRNSLKQRGLIDFKAGFKNKKPPEYKINYLSANVGYKIVPNDAPNNVPKIVPNDAPNNVPKIVPNDAPSLSPLYIDINKTKLEEELNQKLYSDDNDDLMGASAKSEIGFFKDPFQSFDFEERVKNQPEVRSMVEDVTNRLFAAINQIPTSLDKNQVLWNIADQTPDGFVIDNLKLNNLTMAFQSAHEKGIPGNWKYINGAMSRMKLEQLGMID